MAGHVCMVCNTRCIMTPGWKKGDAMTEQEKLAAVKKLRRGDRLSLDEISALLDEFPPEMVRAHLTQCVASPGALDSLIEVLLATPWDTPEEREKAEHLANRLLARFRKIPSRPQ